MYKLWIWICLTIYKDTQADIHAEFGATIRLPCNTTCDGPVDWRYQRDSTIDEEYLCIAAERSGTTNCEGHGQWPRIRVDTPGDFTLTISDVTVSDSGLYHCVYMCKEETRHTYQLIVSMPECTSHPCQNHGTCHEGVYRYKCVCSAGFTGTNCDSDVNECLSEPCQNEGRCINEVRSYKCICRPGFGGTNCDEVVTKVQTGKSETKVVLIYVFTSLGVIIVVVTAIVIRRRSQRRRMERTPEHEMEPLVKPHSQANSSLQSSEHGSSINVNAASLVDMLDVNNSLLEQLCYTGCITSHQKQQIAICSTTYLKNTRLLDIVRHLSDASYRQFIKCLQDNIQHRIAQIIDTRSQANSSLQSSDHGSSIDFNKDLLVELLDVNNNLLEQLCYIGCITPQQKQQIASCAELLDIVRCLSDASYRQFITCLQHNNQHRIAQILDTSSQVIVYVDMKLTGECGINERQEHEQLVKTIMSKSGTEKELGSAVSEQFGPDLELFDVKRQHIRFRMYFLCKSVAGIHQLDQLYVDNTLTDIFNQMIDIPLHCGCSVNTIAWKTEDYLRCVRYFHSQMGLLEDIYNCSWSTENKSDLRIVDSSKFGLLPVSVMDIVLARAVVHLLTSVRKMTTRADVIAVMMLSAVCASWRNIIIITLEEINKKSHWRHALHYVRLYRLQTSRLFTIQGQDSKSVFGLTVLNNKLYVVYKSSDTVAVYSTEQQPYTLTHNLRIDGLREPYDIAVSNYSNCLYITDYRRCVWRVKADHQVDKWMNVENVIALSVASDGQITMLIGVDYQGHSPKDTCRGHLKVYSPDRKLLKTAELSHEEGIVNPWHALQTAKKSFIVCHGNIYTKLNRVCEVDSYGVVLKSYGGLRGAGLGQLNLPVHIALDNTERTLVSDFYNGRVLLLNREFVLERVLLTWSRNWPRCVFYNSKTRQLFVGLNNGAVDVYNVSLSHETAR